MKTLLKFVHVFIGLVVFLSIGYGIQNYDDIFNQQPEEIHEVNNEFEKVASVPDKMESSKDNDTQENGVNNETATDIVSNEDIGTEENMNEQEYEIFSEPIFNYDMEALDHHSLDHINAMVSVITPFVESPNTEWDELHKELYVKNYMHVEKEIEEKNPDVNQYIVEFFDLLSNTDEKDLDTIIIKLENILVICNELSNIKEGE